jgi:hypothetical protein
MENNGTTGASIFDAAFRLRTSNKTLFLGVWGGD